jgi:hypothetical protein
MDNYAGRSSRLFASHVCRRCHDLRYCGVCWTG